MILFSKLKERPALLLIVGTMIVATPRYMEVSGFTVDFMVNTEWWGVVNFLSGIGMAILEGITIWYTWNSWNKAEWSTPGRKPLMTLIVCLLISLAGSVWFAMFARSGGNSLRETFEPVWRGIWAACTTLAPFFVMASAGVAESVRDATAHVIEESAPTEITADPNWKPTISLSPSGVMQPLLTVDDALKTYPDKSQAEIARMTGKSRQYVSVRARKINVNS